jgi:hypothetical protein
MKNTDNLDICALCGCAFSQGEDCWNCFPSDKEDESCSKFPEGVMRAFCQWVVLQNGNIPENNNSDYYETWIAGVRWAINEINKDTRS